MLSRRPTVGITMGDAAGIGPEIIAKCLTRPNIYEICCPLVVGDVGAMKMGVRTADVDLGVHPVSSVSEAGFQYGVVDILDLHNITVEKVVMGKADPMCGRASVEFFKKAVGLVLAGEIDAIATAPISKEAVNMAGYSYAGHTEMLAEFTDTKEYAMMLMSGSLRVIHVTTHLPLAEACRRIKKERVLQVIRLGHQALRLMGIEDPRIGVAGLNPHASEGGLFGNEEAKEIQPAVEAARKEGLNVTGPLPSDTIFVRARGGLFDLVVAMYHDQGHIPLKLVAMSYDEASKTYTSVSGVNVSIGFPVIRTSVDHGTAYGKAGKGTANPQSMLDAVLLAAKMARSR